VVFPQPASAATIVIGAFKFACNFSVKRGLVSNSETGRGGSNLVRRKKFGRCIFPSVYSFAVYLQDIIAQRLDFFEWLGL
jgi:hypothetical protein